MSSSPAYLRTCRGILKSTPSMTSSDRAQRKRSSNEKCGNAIAAIFCTTHHTHRNPYNVSGQHHPFYSSPHAKLRAIVVDQRNLDRLVSQTQQGRKVVIPAGGYSVFSTNFDHYGKRNFGQPSSHKSGEIYPGVCTTVDGVQEEPPQTRHNGAQGGLKMK